MVAFNHASYIREAIEGVVRQRTKFAVELIIGEDCSSDRTGDIVLQYQRAHPQVIRVVSSNCNVGPHFNFIRTIAAARGKYIALCDGDDFWHDEGKLTTQVEFLEAHSDVSLVGSSMRIVSDAGECVCNDVLRLSEECRISYDDIVLDCKVAAVTVCARGDLVRSAMLSSPLLQEPTLPMKDRQLFVELAQTGAVVILPHVLATYRLSTGSATRSNDPFRKRKFAAAANEMLYRVVDRYPLGGGGRGIVGLEARMDAGALEGLCHSW